MKNDRDRGQGRVISGSARPTLVVILAVAVAVSTVAYLFYTGPAQANAQQVLLAVRTPAGPALPGPTEPFSDSLLAKGKFLVASKKLFDPHFREAVVLLVGYGTEGAAGIIINRPTEARLADLLTTVKELKGRPDVVYYGGPVENQRLTMLIRSAEKPVESGNVFGDVYASTSKKALERALKANKTDTQFRVYSGYAGWMPRQLDRELARGDWLVVSADAGTIFEKKPSAIWPELMRRGAEIQVRDRGEFYSAARRAGKQSRDRGGIWKTSSRLPTSINSRTVRQKSSTVSLTGRPLRS